MTLGLPRSLYATWEAIGYDHTWIQQLGNSPPNLLTVFRSKYKLDALVRAGAVQIGDEIYCIIEIDAARTDRRVATVSTSCPRLTVAQKA